MGGIDRQIAPILNRRAGGMRPKWVSMNDVAPATTDGAQPTQPLNAIVVFEALGGKVR